MMMVDEPGVVTCKPKPDKFSFCEPVLAPGGQVVCASEDYMFERCSGDEDDDVHKYIFVPENFQVNTTMCPHNFKCKSQSKYWPVVEGNCTDDKNHLEFLICNEETKSICEPIDNSNSLLTVDNILDSFYFTRIVCKKNPCPDNFWPQIDDNGYFICSYNSLSLFRSTILANRNKVKCKKNQVFIYGRCRPRYYRGRGRSGFCS